MKCTNCSNDIPEGYKFCPECGAPAPQNKTCPNCHTEIPLKMKFCYNCGYNFENAASSSTGETGLNMGDKNVIAGDVIGKKEEISVSGNATIIKNTDATKTLVNCHICGKNLTIVETHSCPNCGQKVCNDCFDSVMGICKSCVQNNKMSAENEYKEALRNMLSDGIIDLQERRTLEALQQKLGLSNEKASELENLLRNSGDEQTFTTMEKLSMEDAVTAYYEEGDINKALELIDGVYKNHMYDEKVLSIYLPIISDCDSDKALAIIESLKADVLEAKLCLFDIYLTKDISQAERVLLSCEKLWPNSLLVRTRRLIFTYRMYEETSRESFLNEFNSNLASLENGETKLEKSYVCICRLLGKAISMDDVKANTEVYHYLVSRVCSGKTYDNITVEVNGTFNTISKALEKIKDGGTITVKEGEYLDSFTVNKNCTIVGDTTDRSKVVIYQENDVVCNIASNCKISGLTFKNTKPVFNADQRPMFNIYTEDCVITNCDFLNSANINVCVCDSVKSLLMKNCNIRFSPNAGLLDFSIGSTFEDITISDVSNDAVVTTKNEKSTFKNCVFTKCKSRIFAIRGNADPQVENCEISFANNGICSYDTSKGCFTNVKVHNCGIGAIAGKETSPKFNNSEFNNNSQTGFYAFDSSTPSLYNCNLHHNSVGNIGIGGEANPYIDSCTLSDVKQMANVVSEQNAKGTIINTKIGETDCAPTFITNGNAKTIFENCVIDRMWSKIYCNDNSKPTIKRCTFNSGLNEIYLSGTADPYLISNSFYKDKIFKIIKVK